jgi:hypothetical protein
MKGKAKYGTTPAHSFPLQASVVRNARIGTLSLWMQAVY